MPHQLPRAAWIFQLASTAFLGAGGILLLLAMAQSGPKDTTLTVAQFVFAAATVALAHWIFVLHAKRGPDPRMFRSPLQIWATVAISALAICFALSAAAGNVWEIAHETAPLDRARLLTLAQPIIGIALCTSMASLALLARPPAAPLAPAPPQP